MKLSAALVNLVRSRQDASQPAPHPVPGGQGVHAARFQGLIRDQIPSRSTRQSTALPSDSSSPQDMEGQREPEGEAQQDGLQAAALKATHMVSLSVPVVSQAQLVDSNLDGSPGKGTALLLLDPGEERSMTVIGARLVLEQGAAPLAGGTPPGLEMNGFPGGLRPVSSLIRAAGSASGSPPAGAGSGAAPAMTDRVRFRLPAFDLGLKGRPIPVSLLDNGAVTEVKNGGTVFSGNRTASPASLPVPVPPITPVTAVGSAGGNGLEVVLPAEPAVLMREAKMFRPLRVTPPSGRQAESGVVQEQDAVLVKPAAGRFRPPVSDDSLTRPGGEKTAGQGLPVAREGAVQPLSGRQAESGVVQEQDVVSVESTAGRFGPPVSDARLPPAGGEKTAPQGLPARRAGIRLSKPAEKMRGVETTAPAVARAPRRSETRKPSSRGEPRPPLGVVSSKVTLEAAAGGRLASSALDTVHVPTLKQDLMAMRVALDQVPHSPQSQAVPLRLEPVSNGLFKTAEGSPPGGLQLRPAETPVARAPGGEEQQVTPTPVRHAEGQEPRSFSPVAQLGRDISQRRPGEGHLRRMSGNPGLQPRVPGAVAGGQDAGRRLRSMQERLPGSGPETGEKRLLNGTKSPVARVRTARTVSMSGHDPVARGMDVADEVMTATGLQGPNVSVPGRMAGREGVDGPHVARLASAITDLASRAQGSSGRLTMQMETSPFGKLRITVVGQGRAVQVRIMVPDRAGRARLAQEGDLLRTFLDQRGVRLVDFKIEALLRDTVPPPLAGSPAGSAGSQAGSPSPASSFSSPHAGAPAAGGQGSGSHPGPGGGGNHGSAGTDRFAAGTTGKLDAVPVGVATLPGGRQGSTPHPDGIDLRI